MLKQVKNFAGFPLRAFLLNEKWQKKLGLTTLKEERVNAVLSFMEGRVLDIGCGSNDLVKKYRSMGRDGLGVDVFPFDGVDQIVDTENMPFNDGSFQRIAMLGCLNHIPVNKRIAVLKEAHRVLSNDGKLLITMISPIIGYICHKLMWWDYDQIERGIHEGEAYGLAPDYLMDTALSAGFELQHIKKFVYNLNRVYCFVKSNKP